MAHSAMNGELNSQGGSFVARPKVSSGKTSGRRVRDPEGARRALLENAVALFERNGYAATSVQSIVDAAELTKGAFYHHFESKEDLLYRVHDEFINYQLGRARSVMADKEQSPDQILRRLITEALLEPMSIYKAEITVFMQERKFLPTDVFAEIQQKRDEFERFFVDVIERGMQEGVFRKKGPARLVAFGIIGMGAWTHVWLDLKGSVTPREIGTIYADILIDGLIERPADA
ncbi:TetR/AcrR family transcriptional regulator [Rhodococcus opacus]|nr:TetR family transcriptional regulator [Rhodococcus wratislaviensis IFP 2016]RKM74460.1 TetR/AcrR family transcriptional regulator [Rhodococcus opacus]CAG7586354.1 HTH-type transcriptional repressor KstR2 [Rhodococcus opacus]